LICAKFLSIGYVFHLGERYKKEALIWPILHRSFIFLALLIVLTMLEELIVGYLRHRAFADSLAEIGGGTLHQAIATSIIMLLILIPSLPFARLPTLSADAYCFAYSLSRAEGSMRRRRRHTAKEPNKMRTASLIAISGLFVQAAHADVVRILTFPNVMLGTWAETAERCTAKDKSNIVIAPAKHGDGAGSCAVPFIVETSGSAGPNYAVHALCTSASLPEKTQIVNIVVRPLGQDRAAMGRSFEDLKTYQRCP